MATKKGKARTPKALQKNLPSDPSAYTALGGKTRHYRVNATGEEISRRQYLTAIRGMSNEAYTRAPPDIKKRPSRGGRGSAKRTKLFTRNGLHYGTTYSWIIDYSYKKWDRFLVQLLDVVSPIDPNKNCRLFFKILGDGIFTTKTGTVVRKGELRWISSDIFDVSLIQASNPVTRIIQRKIGDIDFAIVNAVDLDIYNVDQPVSGTR